LASTAAKSASAAADERGHGVDGEPSVEAGQVADAAGEEEGAVASALGAAVGGAVVACSEAGTASREGAPEEGTSGEGDDLRREAALGALAFVMVVLIV
jgi:hypothetical protein